MSEESDSPMIPDMPHPSSRTFEVEFSTSCLKNRFGFEEVIQEAKRGVIFQTT